MFFKKGAKGDVAPSPSDIEMAQGVSQEGSEADSTEIVPNPNRSTLHSMQFDDGFRYATVRYRLLSINLSNI
jgi:hypothetical protein